jgi:hypothetical protein
MLSAYLELVLALNRCLIFCSPRMAAQLFGQRDEPPDDCKSAAGWKTWLWFLPGVLFGGGYFLFGTPFPYSGVQHFSVLNPHRGYIPEAVADPMVFY